MELVRPRRVMHLNNRTNIILDMDLCQYLGITHRNKKCLVLYSNNHAYDYEGERQDEGFFLKAVDIQSNEEIFGTYGYDRESKGLNLESIKPYAELIEENQRLRKLLADIQKITASV